MRYKFTVSIFISIRDWLGWSGVADNWAEAIAAAVRAVAEYPANLQEEVEYFEITSSSVVRQKVSVEVWQDQYTKYKAGEILCPIIR